MTFERPALITLIIIFGIASVHYALAGMLAMKVSDRLLARAQALQEVQTQIEREGSIEIAPLSATQAAVR